MLSSSNLTNDPSRSRKPEIVIYLTLCFWAFLRSAEWWFNILGWRPVPLQTPIFGRLHCWVIYRAVLLRFAQGHCMAVNLVHSQTSFFGIRQDCCVPCERVRWSGMQRSWFWQWMNQVQLLKLDHYFLLTEVRTLNRWVEHQAGYVFNQTSCILILKWPETEVSEWN